MWRPYWLVYRWSRPYGRRRWREVAQGESSCVDNSTRQQAPASESNDKQPAALHDSACSQQPPGTTPLKKSASCTVVSTDTPCVSTHKQNGCGDARAAASTDRVSLANGLSPWGKEVPIAKRESGKRLVLGEVYVPYDPADPSTVDSQGHATTAAEIEQAAHAFLQASRQNQVDVQHNGQCGYGCVVESYLARQGDPSFTPGAWVVGIRVTDDATWQAIEKGDITGISLMGNAQLVPAREGDTLQPDESQGDAAHPVEAA